MPITTRSTTAHRFHRHAAIASLACVLITACSSTDAYRYSNAEVRPRADRGYCLAAGPNHVLSLDHGRFIPIPDAFSGFELYVQSGQPYSNGQVIALPDPTVSCSLAIYSGTSARTSSAITGTIHIRRIRDTDLLAVVALRSADLAWQFSGTVTFASAIITPSLHPCQVSP